MDLMKENYKKTFEILITSDNDSSLEAFIKNESFKEKKQNS